MTNDDFVDDLPENPIEGQTVWLNLRTPGHWSRQTFEHGVWRETGGMAVPRIPTFLKDKDL